MNGNLYTNIKLIAVKKDIPISRIERDCGLGYAAICKWKVRGARVESVKKVADYLGVTVDDLLKEV